MKSGDELSFRIDSADIAGIGRPAEDFDCAVVSDAVGNQYKSDTDYFRKCVQEMLDANLKEMAITFDDRVIWDEDTECYRFLARVSGERVHCVVTLDALTFGFHVSFEDVRNVESFNAHREKIREIAVRLIQRVQRDAHGRYVVKAELVR